jgi:enoyl-[acyl-carrier protein] reductase II
VIATVVSAKHARSAESAGADALMVTGHEAAAHGGDVTSLVLLPAIRVRVMPTIVTLVSIQRSQSAYRTASTTT